MISVASAITQQSYQWDPTRSMRDCKLKRSIYRHDQYPQSSPPHLNAHINAMPECNVGSWSKLIPWETRSYHSTSDQYHWIRCKMHISRRVWLRRWQLGHTRCMEDCKKYHSVGDRYSQSNPPQHPYLSRNAVQWGVGSSDILVPWETRSYWTLSDDRYPQPNPPQNAHLNSQLHSSIATLVMG